MTSKGNIYTKLEMVRDYPVELYSDIDGNYIYVFYVVECFVFSSNMIKFVT